MTCENNTLEKRRLMVLEEGGQGRQIVGSEREGDRWLFAFLAAATHYLVKPLAAGWQSEL